MSLSVKRAKNNNSNKTKSQNDSKYTIKIEALKTDKEIKSTSNNDLTEEEKRK